MAKLFSTLITLLVFLGSTLDLVSAEKSAGCGKNPTITSGRRSVNVNGKNRNWIIRLPDGYKNDQPYKLIFALHWLNADFNAVDTGAGQYYGVKALAGNSAIFVAPDGLNKGWANAGGEDVSFIDAIMAAVEADLCVETTQRYSMGFSYGGSMSYALACARPKVFRAVAVLSGSLLSGCSGGNDPVAFYGQHGVRDRTLPINGGRQLRDRFVKNNGCTATPAPQEPASGSRRHIITKYTGCKEGYPVQWTAFDEDHVALPQDSGGGDAGPRSWTPAEVWKFFSQFN